MAAAAQINSLFAAPLPKLLTFTTKACSPSAAAARNITRAAPNVHLHHSARDGPGTLRMTACARLDSSWIAGWPRRFCYVPAVAGPGRDVAAGGQGVGVAGAADPYHVGQQLSEQAQRLGRVPALAGPG